MIQSCSHIAAWVVLLTALPGFAEVCDKVAEGSVWDRTWFALTLVPAVVVFVLTRWRTSAGLPMVVLTFGGAAFLADWAILEDVRAEGCLPVFLFHPLIVAGVAVAAFGVGLLARRPRAGHLDAGQREARREALRASEKLFEQEHPGMHSMPAGGVRLHAEEPARYVVMIQWFTDHIPADFCFYEVDKETGLAKRLVDDSAYRPTGRR